MAVPILVYHRITDMPAPTLREYSVRPAVFARQMDWLRRAGWRTVGLDELVASRDDGPPLPARACLITFDDAYAELERTALPALAANGQTATIFACSDRLGAEADALRTAGPHEDAWLMDADALRRAVGNGFTIGSHTATHARLTEVGDAILEAEVARSRARLSEALGTDVRHFAYPFGAYDDRVVAAVAAAGYASAVTTDSGAVTDQEDLRLPRVYVVWGDGATRLLLRLRRRRGEG